ncbi:MAG: hypothetical protein GX581_01950 [Syntrophomonadaceae bacterium]|nr:hypothetical protein [Syntrophomonadaceae bacterium]
MRPLVCFCLLGPPPQGRALCLPFGSASLRTNGPSPRLLAPDPWPLAPDPCTYFFQEPVVAMASGAVPA